MKVLHLLLLSILMVLAMFGNVIHAGNKERGEPCTKDEDCVKGLKCNRNKCGIPFG